MCSGGVKRHAVSNDLNRLRQIDLMAWNVIAISGVWGCSFGTVCFLSGKYYKTTWLSQAWRRSVQSSLQNSSVPNHLMLEISNFPCCLGKSGGFPSLGRRHGSLWALSSREASWASALSGTGSAATSCQWLACQFVCSSEGSSHTFEGQTFLPLKSFFDHSDKTRMMHLAKMCRQIIYCRYRSNLTGDWENCEEPMYYWVSRKIYIIIDQWHHCLTFNSLMGS